MTYKKFKLCELFDITGTKSLDEGKLQFVDNGINFVGRVDSNNGVKGKIQKQSFEPNEANTITATVIGNYKYVKYQEEPYYCSQNINKLKPKFEMNKETALYIIAFVQKFVSIYNGQQGGYKLEELQNLEIELPVKEIEEIDFDYMSERIQELESERIQELESERIQELESYLKVTGLDNCKLTDEDKTILKKPIQCSEFRIGDLFNVYSPQKRFNANAVQILSCKEEGAYPYVVRTSENNGRRGYIVQDEKYLSPANTFSFGQDTATVFFQAEPYFTGDKIKIMQLNNASIEMNDKLACYLISAIRKSFSGFSWGQSSFNENVINSTKILLPVNLNGEPDFEYMEKYIRAMEKMVIADVVKYKDKVLAITKNLVG